MLKEGMMPSTIIITMLLHSMMMMVVAIITNCRLSQGSCVWEEYGEFVTSTTAP
jgi:hypothetical protein